MAPLQMSEEENAEDTTATVEEEVPQEDPEVVALKESITSLESDLKAKKTQLNNLKNTAEKFSSAGYARQVALVENNKRLRGANMADDKFAARAEIMQSFLPVMEELDTIGAKYEGNDFAKTFDALRVEFINSMEQLGASKYIVEPGTVIEVGRVVAVEQEYSDEFAKGTVIRPLKSGLDVSGNVVAPAEVVGSLGSEKDAAGEGFGDSGESE